MDPGPDRQAHRRAELLAPLRVLLADAGVAFRSEPVPGHGGRRVEGLLCRQPDRWGTAQVTVVRARPTEDTDNRRWLRDPEHGYDLDSTGEVAYEVQLFDRPADPAEPVGPRVHYTVTPLPQAAADIVILWHGRRGYYRVDPPVPDERAEERRARREFQSRQVSAATGLVRTDLVLPEGEADVAALDAAALCWNFPRDRTGRYARRVVVPLAGYTPDPAQRGPWLTAHADGDELVVTTEALIGANQWYRWDVTPWLWDRRFAGTPTMARWQVDRVEEAAPFVELLWRGAVTEALDLAGVGVDDALATLLTGTPVDYVHAELTAKWVARLYENMCGAAPWRFAAAHRTWRDARTRLGRPVRDPVVLFGLGGHPGARRPTVALTDSGDVPVLRLVHTATFAVLPRALWELPPALAAHLRGWPPAI